MNLGCTIAGHRADRNHVYNSGYYFSACRRCGSHLMRSAQRDWGPVPRGHRIVWKVGRGSHSLEANYAGVLPIVVDAPLPAPREPWLSTSRALVRTGPCRPARSAFVGAAEEDGGDYQYPRLLLAVVILGAGLSWLTGLVSGR